LSFRIEVSDNSEKSSIIMDFGVSSIAMPHNMAALGIDPGNVRSVFISHGHHDHIGAIREVLPLLSGNIEIIVHEHAFLTDRIHKLPDGSEIPIPSLRKDAVDTSRYSISYASSPMLFAGGYAASITNIPRKTDFEKGMPTTFYKEGSEIFKDNINDDQGIVINVKKKGLVVISGCAHSGIINTIMYAQEITGEEKIYAVIGGFHLTGPHFEKAIQPTIEALKRFSPEIICPCHCTGFKAIGLFEAAFSENFIMSSVGTKINL
jgi:7,8-dihydropterin-6-yl-methyl-4-(beta-D-ribofuranosyl)aminobenzene 5'-phosphate synthase